MSRVQFYRRDTHGESEAGHRNRYRKKARKGWKGEKEVKEGALTVDRRTLRTNTGQRVPGREGIGITWYLLKPCIVLAPLTIMWTPGEQGKTSLRRKCLEG